MGDDASQASQRSGLSGSLLERIRAQREREASVSIEAPPTVPMYSPDTTSSDIGGNSWSMNVSFPRFGGNSEATMSLLEGEEGHQGYSMMHYFQTFVFDVYNGFRSLHPAAQFVIVVILVVLLIILL